MNNEQPNNPLHGINLKQIVERLVAYYGWEQLGLIIEIGCFNYKPSVTSSLRFLRSTPWARTKVEKLYIAMQEEVEQPPSNSQPQENEDLLANEPSEKTPEVLSESSPIKPAMPVEQDDLKQAKPCPSKVQPTKRYKGSQFEQQKPTETKGPPKFKFEYRKPKGNE